MSFLRKIIARLLSAPFSKKSDYCHYFYFYSLLHRDDIGVVSLQSSLHSYSSPYLVSTSAADFNLASAINYTLEPLLTLIRLRDSANTDTAMLSVNYSIFEGRVDELYQQIASFNTEIL